MGRDPKILVTGSGGQVGRALQRLLPDALFLTRVELDITDADSVRAATESIDIVVHLAAETNVDECEADPIEAMRINEGGTKNIRDAARRGGAGVVYLSTDYVFDGIKGSPYTEGDAPHPVNVYGRSKLLGESLVSEMPRHLIIRTSWVFGGGRNFVDSILSAARTSERIEVVDDQTGRPTYARDLAKAIVYAIQQEATGIVNVSGDGPECTWADLAEEALRKAGLGTSVERVDSATYASQTHRLVAPRPRYSVLALDKASSLGFPLGRWEDSLREYVEELL